MNDAFSLDGRTVEFTVRLDEPIALGAYVEIDAPDGEVILAQVTERRVETADGQRCFAGVGRVVGSLSPDGALHRGSTGAFSATEVRAAGPGAVRQHLDALWPDEARLALGTTLGDTEVPAHLRARGFARHTFLCGQSGSGKTYTLGVVLEQLLAFTSLPMVIIDPNSDHVHLGESLVDPADDPTGTAARLAKERSAVQVFGPGRQFPLRVHFGALTLDQQTIVLRLDPLRDRDEHGAFLAIVGRLAAPYTLAEVRDAAAGRGDRSGALLADRIDNLRLLDREIWTAPGEDALAAHIQDGWRAVVLDIGSLAQARDRATMAAGAVSWLWDRRHDRRPVLLVVDEAHNVCPSKPIDADQSMATDLLVAIAGEGRKYGIHLLLATQRPQKLHENVLSQCDNLLLMRMNSASDIEVLQDVFSHVPPALIAGASTFVQGQGLAAGPIAADPVMFATGRRFTPEGGSDPEPVWAAWR